jgi:hypothetical protein
VHRSPLAREPGAPGPQDPRAPLGVGTWWHAGCRDPKWPLGTGTRKLLGPRDPKQPPGAGTQFRVRGSGWAPGSRTQKPPYLVALLRGPGPGTQNQL